MFGSSLCQSSGPGIEKWLSQQQWTSEAFPNLPSCPTDSPLQLWSQQTCPVRTHFLPQGLQMMRESCDSWSWPGW